MVVLGVWGKYYCVCVVVIDLRYMPDLLWDYPVLDKSYLLSVLLNYTCSFSQFPVTGAQDLQLNDQNNPSASYGIGKSFTSTKVAALMFIVHLRTIWFPIELVVYYSTHYAYNLIQLTYIGKYNPRTMGTTPELGVP